MGTNPATEATATTETSTESAETSTESALSWAMPHLIAGRGKAVDALAFVLILVGAATDTLAFRNTLELLMPTEGAKPILFMALGATAMALIAAGFLGITYAVYRRDRPTASRLLMRFAAVAWFGLGFMMLLVRAFTQAPGSESSTGTLGAPSSSGSPWSSLLTAGFFFSVYVISGAGTVFETERHYNPVYFAYVRLSKALRNQEAEVVALEAQLERARAVADMLAGDLDREDHRKRAAILERQAFGAEAANMARVLMAAMLKDPAKTGLTETGPVPELPEFPGAAA
jgi:hypothetical protein